MSLKILFVASLHHPDELAAARATTPEDEPPPLFPPSVLQHFWERVFRRRGYELDIFYRNLPTIGQIRAQQHHISLSVNQLLSALAYRIPPELNPELRARNQRLLQQAETFKPDVLWLVGDNRVIYPQTLATIKQMLGCKLVYATGTSPIVFSRPIERQAAPLYDLVLVNDFYHGIQWLELGARRMECLPLTAADPDFHHPYADETGELANDVTFIGTLLPDHLYSRRVAALAALTNFDLGIWSVHAVPAALQTHRRGSALGETMLRVLSAAKMTINPNGNFMRYGGNMRLFEAAGVGTLQLTDDVPGVREWFTLGENIVIYHDTADLCAKVAYYLQHDSERELLAQRAREHVYAHHTYEQRVDRFEQMMSDLI